MTRPPIREVHLEVTLHWDLFATLLRDNPEELVRLIREEPGTLLRTAHMAMDAAFAEWLQTAQCVPKGVFDVPH